MRTLRTICVPAFVVAIPAFMAFQVAARPMLLCGKDACDLVAQLIPCMMRSVESQTVVAEVVLPGCCREDAPKEPGVGCCESVKETSPCSGCLGKNSSEQLSDHDESNDSPSEPPCCPEGLPMCALCPSIPVAADLSSKPRVPELRVQVLPSLHIPSFLAHAVQGPWGIRSHAPPLSDLTRAGPERRIDLCSFLL